MNGHKAPQVHMGINLVLFMINLAYVSKERRDFMSDCIFCKIVNKEIPSRIVYQDDVVTAFMDMSQVTSGHILVVPNEHRKNLMEYEAELAAEVFSRVQRIARGVMAFDPEVKGLNVLLNNGELAYQTVFHSHIHLIPRYGSEDDFSIHFGNNSDAYTDEELDQVSHRLAQAIEGEK